MQWKKTGSTKQGAIMKSAINQMTKNYKATNTVSATVPATKGTTTGTNAAANTTKTAVNSNAVVTVSREYVLNTLCRDGKNIFGNCIPFEGTEMFKILAVSKDILFYALYKTGEHMINDNIANKTGVTHNTVMSVPMNFLPPTLRAEWQKTINERVPEGYTTTLTGLTTIWQKFVSNAVCGVSGNYFTAPTTTPTGSDKNDSINVSKGILMYTLYNEGRYLIGNYAGQGKPVSIDWVTKFAAAFLPTELLPGWQNVINTTFKAGGNFSAEEVLGTFKGYLLETIYKGNPGVIEKCASYIHGLENCGKVKHS